MASLTEEEKQERKIKENWPYCGVLLFRKKEGMEILSSGSIVKFKSPYFPDCECCLVLSDRFHDRSGEISADNYYFELTKLNGTLKKVELIDVGKPEATSLYRPTPGLVIIPIYPPSTSSINYIKLRSIFGYRTIFSSYYYVNKGDDIDIRCYIAGSFETKQFKLTVKKDDKGSVQQYELQAAGSDSVYQSFSDIMKDWPHLYPHGAVIIISQKAIGVLSFTEEGMISPIFFTQETLSCEVCLFQPLYGAISNIPEVDGRTPVDTIGKGSSVHSSFVKDSVQPPLSTDPSLHHPLVTGRDIKRQMPTSKSCPQGTQTQHPTNFPSTNDDGTVYTDDRRTDWEKGEGFARFLLSEYTKKVEELQRCQQEVSLVKEHNSQLRIDMKKTEKQNEELRARNEESNRETEELRRANEMLHTKIRKANSTIEMLIRQRSSAVFAEACSSNTGSNDMDAAKASGGSSTSIEQRASDDSSEEEPFFDASNDAL